MKEFTALVWTTRICWKAIADHLDKTEWTVQRWEKSKALPVRRLKVGTADEQGRVFAYKSELEAWWQDILARPQEDVDLRTDVRTPPPDIPTPSTGSQPRPHLKALSRRVFFDGRDGRPGPHGDRPVLMRDPFVNVSLKPASGRVTLAVRPFKDLDAIPIGSSWRRA
jgi:hypothetical protein